MRLLVTGATGFIGARTAPLLADRHDVICLARDAGAVSDPRIETIACDLNDFDTKRLPQRVDAVLHMAQSARYREFPDGAAEVFAVNVHATARLLDYAMKAGAERFCLVSSGTVYEPYEGRMHEDAALAPTSLNGASKLAGELVTRPYKDAMRVSALRLFFPYGPNQQQRLVPDLIARIRDGRPVTVTGGEGLKICPTYVDDIAGLIALALEEAWQGPVNVAAPEGVTIRRAAERIGEALGLGVNYVEEPGTPAVVMPDTSLLARLAPTFAFTPFDEGVRKTVAATRGSAA